MANSVGMSLEVRPRLFTVEEYARMGELGIIGPEEHVQLIEGKIVAMSPQNPRHAKILVALTRLLLRTCGETHDVLPQVPLTLGVASEPEPDLALVRLGAVDAADRHPDRADLVIEVADSSLPFDRKRKGSLYAKYQLPDYWIINTQAERVEVRRKPAEHAKAQYGWDYEEVTVLAPGQHVSPLLLPHVTFEVAELLRQRSTK